MKILLVCLGNICRSPMAEGILRSKIEKAGLDIEVDSAGTANYHVGELPHKNTIKIAAENGLDIRDLKARQFQTRDFEEFYVIFFIDSYYYVDVMRLSKTDLHTSKIQYFLNELNEGTNVNVPDPWFGGYDGFQEVYRMLERTCDKIVEKFTLDNEQLTMKRR